MHRLDKETSGVLLAAKTAETHQKLVTLFSQRQIEKTYLAICVGSPGDLTVNAPIGRHPTKRKEMSINREKGKEAITRFKVLEIKENLTLVEAALITGRTHQIRVHLKHCNTPVLGDSIYGSSSANKKAGITRQLLHAHRMRFIHPITQKPLELTAPLPADMSSLFYKFVD